MKFLVRIVIVVMVGLVSAVLLLIHFLCTRQQAFNTYVSQLRGQGEKLTFQELISAYPRQTNHSFLSLSNVIAGLGPCPGDIGNQHIAQIIDPPRARVSWGLEQPPGLTLKNSLTNGSWIELNRVLAAAAPSLSSLRQVLQKPDSNIGPRANSWDTPSMWQEQKNAANWLGYATLANLHDSQRDAALTNIQAIGNLANLHRDEVALAIQMTRVAVAQIGLDLTWEALQLGSWKEEQLAALQRCWEATDFIAGLEKAMEGERALPLEALASARSATGPWRVNASSSGRSSHSRKSRPYPAALLYNDVQYWLRHLQARVEFVRQLQRGTPFPIVIQSFRDKQAEVDAKFRSVTRIFYLFSAIGMVNYEKAVATGARTETSRRLAVVAIALRRYELKQGHLPRNLEELTPGFLGCVPSDCLDGKSLKYRLNNDGTFSLYSAGMDGRDDGGDPTPLKTGTTNSIVVRRDIVWPLAAKVDRGRGI